MVLFIWQSYSKRFQVSEAKQLRLTEFVKLDWRDPANHIKHLDVTAWDTQHPGDVASVRLATYNGLEHVETLDVSRLGLDTGDVMMIFSSSFSNNLRWLDLSGNAIGEDAIRWICYLTQKGYVDLEWLDLRGTDFEATPYFELGFCGELDYWRMPRITRDLAEEFGVQRWMTTGFPMEEEGETRRAAKKPERFK